VASLREAIDRLPELAATQSPHKPRSPTVYSLHADTGCISRSAPDASTLGPVHQHHTQQRSPMSRVLHAAAMRSNRVAPLNVEGSPKVGDQSPHALQLPLPASRNRPQLRMQLQDRVSPTDASDASQQQFRSPQKATVVTAEEFPASSPCRSPFARASMQEESQHIQRALQLIRVSKVPSELWMGLKQLKADRGTAKPGWADEWISHEALEVIFTSGHPVASFNACMHACMHSSAALIPVEHPLESMSSSCLKHFYPGTYWFFH